MPPQASSTVLRSISNAITRGFNKPHGSGIGFRLAHENSKNIVDCLGVRMKLKYEIVRGLPGKLGLKIRSSGTRY